MDVVPGDSFGLWCFFFKSLTTSEVRTESSTWWNNYYLACWKLSKHCKHCMQTLPSSFAVFNVII